MVEKLIGFSFSQLAYGHEDLMESQLDKNITQNQPAEILTDNNLPTKRTVEESLELQLEYLEIHRKKIIGNLTFQELSKMLGISLTKAKMACHWVRKNWEVLANDEYLVDAEALICDRILELDKQIEEIKKGDMILLHGAPIRLNNDVLRRIDRTALLKAINERREYEKLRMDIQGIIKRANMVMLKDVNVNTTTYNLENKAVIFDKMSHEDKEAYLNILGKYGQPPTRQ